MLLYLINLQFKIFFRINSLQLCKTLTRAVETRGFPDLESFPMAQQVTFCYYRGRLHIFSEEYVCETMHCCDYALLCLCMA